MIYLDAAATTLEKPEAVGRAMAEAVRTMSSPGRGNYPASRLAEKTAFSCRSEAAELFDVDSAEKVIFTCGATHGLNIALRSLVEPGGRVVVSGYEHNAVIRVLHAIPDVELVVIDAPLFCPREMAQQFSEALKNGADAAVCTHVSNVYGYVLPMDEIARECRRCGVPLVVDASQSAGILPVSLAQWEAAFIAMPGHKGLYGPQGTGLLLCGAEAKPLLYGGTGSASRSRGMPDDLPDRLEAGTHNMPGIAGLLEGIRFVRRCGTERIARHERELVRLAAQHLSQMEGVSVYEAEEDGVQAGVLSFTVAGSSCEAIGEALAAKGVAVRTGLHCAPLAHRTAGSLESGTVRVSPSIFTAPEQIERFCGLLQGTIRESARF
jgi:selenocysteine lyase/cysteine desulfurase